MRTLSCPAVDCIHNKDGGRCAARRATLKKRGTLLECLTYRPSEEFKERVGWFDTVSGNVRGSDQKERMPE